MTLPVETPITVTVVVPTHDRPAPLARCLDALARTDRRAIELDVIVVDDGGRSPAEPVVGRFDEVLDITCLRQTRRGPAAARNAGLRHATGDVVAFTDDDCAPEPGWASAVAMATYQRATAEPATRTLVGGRCLTVLHSTPAVSSEWIASFAERELGFVTSNNMAIWRTDLIEAGGFSESFGAPAGEDRELCRRLVREGWTIVQVEDAVVAHAHRLDWRAFVRQHRRFGEAALALDDVDGAPDRLRARDRARMLAQATHDGGPRLLGGVVVSQAAVATGAASAVLRRTLDRGRASPH